MYLEVLANLLLETLHFKLEIRSKVIVYSFTKNKTSVALNTVSIFMKSEDFF